MVDKQSKFRLNPVLIALGLTILLLSIYIGVMDEPDQNIYIMSCSHGCQIMAEESGEIDAYDRCTNRCKHLYEKKTESAFFDNI